MGNDYFENLNYCRNEVFNKLELYLQEQKVLYKLEKDKNYIKDDEEFFINAGKGIVAKDLINWLKQFIETENYKLKCF